MIPKVKLYTLSCGDLFKFPGDSDEYMFINLDWRFQDCPLDCQIANIKNYRTNYLFQIKANVFVQKWIRYKVLQLSLF